MPNIHPVTGEPFDKPALFVRGNRSDYITDADIPLIKTLFPQSEIVTIENAGHWVHAGSANEIIRSGAGVFSIRKPLSVMTQVNFFSTLQHSRPLNLCYCTNTTVIALSKSDLPHQYRLNHCFLTLTPGCLSINLGRPYQSCYFSKHNSTPCTKYVSLSLFLLALHLFAPAAHGQRRYLKILQKPGNLRQHLQRIEPTVRQ